MNDQQEKQKLKEEFGRRLFRLIKVKLPLFKRIILADNNNWIELDYQKVANLCFLRGYQCIPTNFVKRNMDYGFSLNGDVQTLSYKEVNL